MEELNGCGAALEVVSHPATVKQLAHNWTGGRVLLSQNLLHELPVAKSMVFDEPPDEEQPLLDGGHFPECSALVN